MSFVNLLRILHDLGFIEVMTQHRKFFSYMLHILLLIQSFAVAGSSNHFTSWIHLLFTSYVRFQV